MSARRGDWIMTASGRKFWPFDPRVEDVCLEDIAHHLSLICRFTGAVRQFYSVAEHSVRVAECFGDDTLASYGLLHDASEAYLSDIARPVKHDPSFAFYREAESRIQAVIYEAFGLDPQEPEAVSVMDRVLLRTEQRDLMPLAADDEDRLDAVPLRWKIRPWEPLKAEITFVEYARNLGRKIVLDMLPDY